MQKNNQAGWGNKKVSIFEGTKNRSVRGDDCLIASKAAREAVSVARSLALIRRNVHIHEVSLHSF